MISSSPGTSPQVGTVPDIVLEHGRTADEPAIRLPEPAPITPQATPPAPPAPAGGLPLTVLRHLLHRLGDLKLSQLPDLVPALQILGLALAAGLTVRITGAVLTSINDTPLLGGLLELVGLIRFVQLVSRHALKQQKRAELLARIQELRRQLLG